MQSFLNAVGSEVSLITTPVKKAVFSRHFAHTSIKAIIPKKGAVTVIGYESHVAKSFDNRITIDYRYNLIYVDLTEGGLGRTVDCTELAYCPSFFVGCVFGSVAALMRCYGGMRNNKELLLNTEAIVSEYIGKLASIEPITVKLTKAQTFVFCRNFDEGRFIKNLVLVAMNAANGDIMECGNIINRLDKMGRFDKVAALSNRLAEKINIKLFNEISN